MIQKLLSSDSPKGTINTSDALKTFATSSVVAALATAAITILNQLGATLPAEYPQYAALIGFGLTALVDILRRYASDGNQQGNP